MVLEYLEKEVSNKQSKDEIEKVLHGVCNKLSKKISIKCNQFVDEYAEIVIELISQEISPEEACTIMELCEHQPIKIEGTVENNDTEINRMAFINNPTVIII